uniref:Uncharacterized protein n=1 Tax=viral metagenome TaxID=1070528 RepID=A0A6M3KV29_9ZZZZ
MDRADPVSSFAVRFPGSGFDMEKSALVFPDLPDIHNRNGPEKYLDQGIPALRFGVATGCFRIVV